MNRQEHLLTCLGEECAEVQKVVSKSNRFGTDDHFYEGDDVNGVKIVKEFLEATAVFEMLLHEGVLSLDCLEKNGVAELKTQKKIKVEKFMKYAEERGKLV